MVESAAVAVRRLYSTDVVLVESLAYVNVIMIEEGEKVTVLI